MVHLDPSKLSLPKTGLVPCESIKQFTSMLASMGIYPANSILIRRPPTIVNSPFNSPLWSSYGRFTIMSFSVGWKLLRIP